MTSPTCARRADRDEAGKGDPRETVVARLRPHVRGLVWPGILLLLIAGATGFFAGTLPEEWMNLAVLAAAGILFVVGCVVPWLRWMSRGYTITTRRTVVRSGLLARERRELLHSRASDVTVRASPLQSMVGSGDVRIEHQSASEPARAQGRAVGQPRAGDAARPHGARGVNAHRRVNRFH